MARFAAVTFDCYGTLIDWESGILSAVGPLLRRHGRTVPDEEILAAYAEIEPQAQRGEWIPYREVLARVVDGFATRYSFVAAPADRSVIADSLPSWHPFADTVAALKDLQRTLRLGIISNVDDDLFAGTARHLGVPFDWVVTAQQTRAYKPSPLMFEKAFATIGLPRDAILHAAQSLFHDIVPAKHLGMTAVWIDRRGMRSGHGATPPAQARPDATFPDLREFARAAPSL